MAPLPSDEYSLNKTGYDFFPDVGVITNISFTVTAEPPVTSGVRKSESDVIILLFQPIEQGL